MRKKNIMFRKVFLIILISALITITAKLYDSVDRAAERKHQELGLAYAGKWEALQHVVITTIRKSLLDRGYLPDDAVLRLINYWHSALCEVTNSKIPDQDIERVFFWRLCVLVPNISQREDILVIRDDLMRSIEALGEDGGASVYLDKLERYTMLRGLIAIYGKRREAFFPVRENRIRADINVLSVILKKVYSADVKFILERHGNKTNFFEFIDQSQDFVITLFLSRDYSDECPGDLLLAWNTIDNYLKNFLPVAHQTDAYYPRDVKSSLNNIEVNRIEMPEIIRRNYPACTSKLTCSRSLIRL